MYIGKAGGAMNKLHNRIMQYVKHGYGEAKNHRGGRAIWQIDDNKNLLLGYYVCENPEAEEHRLLVEYFNKYGKLPLANWNVGNRNK